MRSVRGWLSSGSNSALDLQPGQLRPYPRAARRALLHAQRGGCSDAGGADRRGVRGILSVFVPIRIRLARRGDRLDSACADVPAAGGRCGQVGAHQALGRLDRGGRLGVSVLEILVQSVPGSGVGSYRRLRDLFPAACRVFPHVAESVDPRAAAAADGHAGRIALLSGAAGGADPQRHRADLGGAALSAGLSAAVCPELRRFRPARLAAEAAAADRRSDRRRPRFAGGGNPGAVRRGGGCGAGGGDDRRT